MEQRRTIGYILLALAAVVCLVSNVWFIIKMPMGGEKVSHLIFRALPEVIALLAVVYTFVRPGKTMNLKLDIRERRIKKDGQDSRWMVYRCIECLDGCSGDMDVGENSNG